MPKYYVTSGDIREVLIRGSSSDAVIAVFQKAVLREPPVVLSHLVKVSEQGFESINEDDILFSTELMLKIAGIDGEFEETPPVIDEELSS